MTGSRKWLLIAGMALILVIGVYAVRTPIFFGIAASSADSRPSLLSDAEWGDSASARKFATRFRAGVADSELLDWLSDNQFETEASRNKAVKMVEGFPCREKIDVQWTASDGRLVGAIVSISEAGCV